MDIRMAFFSTIATLFLNYQESIQTTYGTKEFNLKHFKSKSEVKCNKKFYDRFFGDHPINVQNQLFTNFIQQVIDGSNDENTILKRERFDAMISLI